MIRIIYSTVLLFGYGLSYSNQLVHLSEPQLTNREEKQLPTQLTSHPKLFMGIIELINYLENPASKNRNAFVNANKDARNQLIKAVESYFIGINADAIGMNSIAIGASATANNDNDIAMGYSATAGSTAQPTRQNNMALGASSRADGGNSTAIGYQSVSSGMNSVALGPYATAAATNSLAIGYQSVSSGLNSVALGPLATAAATNSLAIGYQSVSSGLDSVALGPLAAAAATNSLALGSAATVGHTGAVALGSGSSTATAVSTSSTTLNGVTYNFAGASPTSTVSIGSAGNERTITNVAAGRLSATSTDAVNGSQLYATNQALIALGTSGSTSVTALGNNLAAIFGGNISYNSATNAFSGQFTYNSNQYASIQDVFNAISSSGPGPASTPYYSTDDGGVHGGNYNGDGATAPGALAAGVNASASGLDSTAVGVSTTAAAQGTVAVGANSQATAINSVAIGSGAVAESSNSVAIGSNSIADRDNSVSFGSAGNERQLTHVAAGTAPTDAVNVRQMNDQINQKASEVKEWSKNYTDEHFTRANAGIAAAIAAAGIPQAYMPDNSSGGIALGTYHGQIGFAMGLSNISPSGRYVFKVNGTASSQGDYGGSAGMALIW
ncbi:MAG: YadA family autotransporter adhesin [Legionella sp.]